MQCLNFTETQKQKQHARADPRRCCQLWWERLHCCSLRCWREWVSGRIDKRFERPKLKKKCTLTRDRSHLWKLTYSESRELEPDDENSLEGEIPREVVQDYTKCKALGEVEEAKDNPICKPLNIILVSGGLERLK